MVDTRHAANRLVAAWLSTGNALAAAAGALVALVALRTGVDVDVAALRGGLTTIAVLVIVRYSARALRWSESEPHETDRK
ncbi:MAG: hypothetical protein L6Q99_03230 [Planctomycetes bacterium]|nr:hypothetical protein [Planctomycetota bacterium]